MKSLAKIVAMGLVMSSVPVMGAWAKDLEVTRRDQWDYQDRFYTYRAYTPFHHTDNNFHKPYPLSRTFLREREKQQFLPEPLLLSFY